MAKDWYFYDSGGTRRRVTTPYLYDAAGTLRTVVAGYFYDANGTRRQFYQPPGAGIGQVVYSAYGSALLQPAGFVVPPGVTEIYIACVGGGGGGNRRNNNPRGCGGGGGGLAYARMTVVPGTTSGVLPGIAGRGSDNTNPGVNGGDSKFQSTDLTPLVYVAGYGGRGATHSPTAGGAGGTGLINTPATGVIRNGGAGGTGGAAAAGGGGGGGYNGTGGLGSQVTGGAGSGGSAGGGGGYTSGAVGFAGGGGGVQLFGEGASGAGGIVPGRGGGAGSGGNAGELGTASTGGRGGRHGGGGCGTSLTSSSGVLAANGAGGAVCIRWGDPAMAFPALVNPIEYVGDFVCTPADLSSVVYQVSRNGSIGQAGLVTPFYPAIKNGANLRVIAYLPSSVVWSLTFDNILTNPSTVPNFIATYCRGVQIDGLGDLLIPSGGSGTYNALDASYQITAISGPAGWIPNTSYTCRFLY
jgi:hypothetical protein